MRVPDVVRLSGIYAGHFSGHQAIGAVGLRLPTLSCPRAWPTCGWKEALAWVGVPAFCAGGSFKVLRLIALLLPLAAESRVKALSLLPGLGTFRGRAINGFASSRKARVEEKTDSDRFASPSRAW